MALDKRLKKIWPLSGCQKPDTREPDKRAAAGKWRYGELRCCILTTSIKVLCQHRWIVSHDTVKHLIERTLDEFSLVNGFRLLSRYTLSDGTVIYIITEADRSATTILLPSEY